MEVELTQGKVARIDDQDWPLIAPYQWYAVRTETEGRWYARAAIPNGRRNPPKVYMHNLILGIKNVDHWSTDGLDNRRANLRPSTTAQNQQNTGSRGGTSRFKGVSWYARHEKWQVMFNCAGKTHFVGYFTDEVEAAKAYDGAILPLAGEFARLNFPNAR
jgi:hypothetical protein